MYRIQLASNTLPLPNEILRIVFSLLPHTERVYFKHDEGDYHGLPQILVLRTVSRQFRIVANEDGFWEAGDTDFASLLSQGADDYSNNNQPRNLEREDMFFKALFDDKNFARRLNRKTEWTFSSFPNLFYVMQNVSHFSRNAERITLRMNDKTEMAINELAVCQRIKALYIYGAYNINSFDTIVKSCPDLECLHLDDLGNYDTLGTIEHNLLQTLFISIRTNEPYVEPRLSKFLPINSAKTLTSLNITGFSMMSYPATLYDKKLLDSFINLAHLSIGYLNNELCDLLIHTNVRLVSLKVGILSKPFSVQPEKKYLDLLKSPSLDRLELLALSVTGEIRYDFSQSFRNMDAYFKCCAPIVEVITTHRKTIKRLELNMAIHVSWLHYLPNMTNLMSLHLFVPIFPVMGSAFRDNEESLISNDDAALKIERIFKSVYQSHIEKPALEVTFQNDYLWYPTSDEESDEDP